MIEYVCSIAFTTSKLNAEEAAAPGQLQDGAGSAEAAGAEPPPGGGLSKVHSTDTLSHGLNFEATTAAMAEEVIAPFRARRQAMSERSQQRQRQLLSELPQ